MVVLCPCKCVEHFCSISEDTLLRNKVFLTIESYMGCLWVELHSLFRFLRWLCGNIDPEFQVRLRFWLLLFLMEDPFDDT